MTVNTAVNSQKAEPLHALPEGQQPAPPVNSVLLRTVRVWLAPTSVAPGPKVKGVPAKHPPETTRFSLRTPVTVTAVVARVVSVTTTFTFCVHTMFVLRCGAVTLAASWPSVGPAGGVVTG